MRSLVEIPAARGYADGGGAPPLEDIMTEDQEINRRLRRTLLAVAIMSASGLAALGHLAASLKAGLGSSAVYAPHR